MPSKEEIIAVLNEIPDPCSLAAGVRAGLYEMGLVRRLELTPQGGVRLCIGVTEPGCLMAPLFAASARERLERLAGIGPIEIELDQRHDWEPEDMDPAYRARLEETRRRRVR